MYKSRKEIVYGFDKGQDHFEHHHNLLHGIFVKLFEGQSHFVPWTAQLLACKCKLLAGMI